MKTMQRGNVLAVAMVAIAVVIMVVLSMQAVPQIQSVTAAESINKMQSEFQFASEEALTLAAQDFVKNGFSSSSDTTNPKIWHANAALIQSTKLAKNSLQDKMQTRVGNLLADLATRRGYTSSKFFSTVTFNVNENGLLAELASLDGEQTKVSINTKVELGMALADGNKQILFDKNISQPYPVWNIYKQMYIWNSFFMKDFTYEVARILQKTNDCQVAKCQCSVTGANAIISDNVAKKMVDFTTTGDDINSLLDAETNLLNSYFSGTAIRCNYKVNTYTTGISVDRNQECIKDNDESKLRQCGSETIRKFDVFSFKHWLDANGVDSSKQLTLSEVHNSALPPTQGTFMISDPSSPPQISLKTCDTALAKDEMLAINPGVFLEVTFSCTDYSHVVGFDTNAQYLTAEVIAKTSIQKNCVPEKIIDTNPTLTETGCIAFVGGTGGEGGGGGNSCDPYCIYDSNTTPLYENGGYKIYDGNCFDTNMVGNTCVSTYRGQCNCVPSGGGRGVKGIIQCNGVTNTHLDGSPLKECEVCSCGTTGCYLGVSDSICNSLYGCLKSKCGNSTGVCENDPTICPTNGGLCFTNTCQETTESGITAYRCVKQNTYDCGDNNGCTMEYCDTTVNLGDPCVRGEVNCNSGAWDCFAKMRYTSWNWYNYCGTAASNQGNLTDASACGVRECQSISPLNYACAPVNIRNCQNEIPAGTCQRATCSSGACVFTPSCDPSTEICKDTNGNGVYACVNIFNQGGQ
jgi:hypothetical protein